MTVLLRMVPMDAIVRQIIFNGTEDGGRVKVIFELGVEVGEDIEKSENCQILGSVRTR